MADQTTLDVERVREDFPILARTIHGKPLVYLDTAASAQRPLAVIEATDRFYRRHNANVHRGVHTLSQEATELYEGARTKLARHLNAASEREIIFTRGTTNVYAHGLKNHATFPLGKGPTIGLGANVHPALHRKFTQLAREIDLPYSVETMPRSSGTDAMAMQITAAGVPTMVIGIPIRYMHTPYELTTLMDIRRAGRLLAYRPRSESEIRRRLREAGFA